MPRKVKEYGCLCGEKRPDKFNKRMKTKCRACCGREYRDRAVRRLGVDVIRQRCREYRRAYIHKLKLPENYARLSKLKENRKTYMSRYAKSIGHDKKRMYRKRYLEKHGSYAMGYYYANREKLCAYHRARYALSKVTRAEKQKRVYDPRYARFRKFALRKTGSSPLSLTSDQLRTVFYLRLHQLTQKKIMAIRDAGEYIKSYEADPTKTILQIFSTPTQSRKNERKVSGDYKEPKRKRIERIFAGENSR